MAKQVEPAREKPKTRMARRRSRAIRLALARANSIMARGSQSPTREAADTFAVLTCHAHHPGRPALPMPARVGRLKAKPLRGALHAAATRPPRRGQLQLRGDGQAFVAIDESYEENGL